MGIVNFFYNFLSRIGYTHPPHIPLTHMPTGLVVGAFIFSFIALIFRRPTLVSTAGHCLILSIAFLIPTVVLGYTDWQRHFAGAWLFPIKMKIALSIVLFVLLAIAVISNYLGISGPTAKLTLSTLSFFAVVGLGYFGGQLVLSGKCPPCPEEFQAGAKLYQAHCASCHPNGGNIFSPKLPVRGAPQLKDFETFLAFMRDPKRPDGSPGTMPAYPPKKLSDQQVEDLYRYIIYVFGIAERKS